MSQPDTDTLHSKATANAVSLNLIPFEILSAPIAPIPNVPYVQQGFFVQLTNLTGSTATISLLFDSVPLIASAPKPIVLAANLIVNSDAPVDFTKQFLSPPSGRLPGFYNIQIGPSQTYLFGVQAILLPTQSVTKLGTTPQEAFTSRGYAFFQSTSPAQFLVLPTIRQSFTDYNAAGAPIGFSQSAYPVPVTTL